MNLTEKFSCLNDLERIRLDAITQHDFRIRKLDQDISKLKIGIEATRQGFDVAKIDLAKTVIRVVGQFAAAGEDRKTVLREAIDQLATGKYQGEYRLERRYLGTKSYDRWHGQRVSPPYGMAPTHGSVIFEIGLTTEVRKRSPRTLTTTEIEAAVYYLNALEMIQEAEKQAGAA